MNKSLLKPTIAVMFMTSLSRLAGFCRDIMTAYVFGASSAFDAFAVAFKIPNFMRRLFAEGSFSQAFIPILSGYQHKHSHDETKQFVSAMTGTLGIILMLITILGISGAPWLIRLFAPGFDHAGQRFDLAVMLLRVMFPYLLLISLTALSGAILNTYYYFWVTALTPILLNLCMILATFYLSSRFTVPIMSLAIGVLIAGGLQLLFTCPFLRRLHLLSWPKFTLHNAGVRQVLRAMIPSLFGVSVGQINLLLDTVFASLLVVGSVSWLYYADRLMEFPLGIFGNAIATVMLPHLSRCHLSSSITQFTGILDWALHGVLFFSIPAALGLALVAGPILSTLFQYGLFDAHAVLMTQQSLIIFACGLPAFMLVKIFAATYYARQDIRTPVRIGVITMLTNMVLNALFIWPLAHVGIALATTLAAWLNASCLFCILYRRGIYQPKLTTWRSFLFSLSITNLLLIVWIKMTCAPMHSWLQQTMHWRILHLSELLLSSIFIYLVSLWISGFRPMHLLLPQSVTTIIPKTENNLGT